MKNETSKRLQDNFDKDNKLKSELNYGNKNSKNSTSS